MGLAGPCQGGAEAEPRDRVWALIRGEWEAAEREVLLATGQDELLEHDGVLKRSIERRTSSVDPLAFVQLELIRRARSDAAGKEAVEEDARLERARFLAVSGIASGMRSTG